MALPPETQRYIASRYHIERRRIIEKYVKQEAEIVQDLIDRRLLTTTVRTNQHLAARLSRARDLGRAYIDAFFAAFEQTQRGPDDGETDDLASALMDECRAEQATACEKLLGDQDRMDSVPPTSRGQLEASITRQFVALQQELRAWMNIRRFELDAELSRTPRQPPVGQAGVSSVPSTKKTSGGTVPKATRKPKRPAGRPVSSDEKQDKRIADAWESKNYKTYADLGRALSLEGSTVERAVDRERKRAQRSRRET